MNVITYLHHLYRWRGDLIEVKINVKSCYECNWNQMLTCYPTCPTSVDYDPNSYIPPTREAKTTFKSVVDLDSRRSYSLWGCLTNDILGFKAFMQSFGLFDKWLYLDSRRSYSLWGLTNDCWLLAFWIGLFLLVFKLAS